MPTRGFSNDGLNGAETVPALELEILRRVMKTAKILTVILISAIGVLAIGAVATYGWRAERGLTLTALVAKSPAGLEGRLREFDEKLADANVKRESIRAQLAKYEVKEREIGSAAAQTLARLDSETRDAVKRELRAGTASADVAANPDAALAFEQFQEALVLRRESNALRSRLAQYELGMTRALAERDRLERRIELIDSLGYDPDTSDASSTAAENGLLDELAAMTDESTDERAARENRLRPTDVVPDADADRDALVDSVFAGSDAADTDAAPESERLSERLSQLAEERNARKNILSRILPNSPGKIAATLAVGFGVSVLAVLALGVVGLFVATGSSSSGVSQTVVTGSGQGGAPVVIVNGRPEQEKPGRLLTVAIATCVGLVLAGPLGAIFGLIVGICWGNWRALVRALGVFGFVLLGIAAAAFVFFALMCALIF